MKQSLLLVLLVALLQPAPAAAQLSGMAPCPPPIHPLGARQTISPSVVDPIAVIPERQPGYERDRELGGLYGLGVGALAGGVGFGSVVAAANSNSGNAGYWVLALFVGGIGGGAVGTVTGVIMGVPRAADGSLAVPKDRGKGALRGLKVGAAVGGLGFVLGNYALTSGDPEQSAVQTALIGTVFGAAVGAAVGSVIGVPAETTAAQQQVRQRPAVFRVAPSLTKTGRIGLTGSLRLP